jgi:predicted nuclease of predicted toxin-antitoxin system
MPIKFYTDTHVPKQVALQLRLRGVDIVRCEDVGLKLADDEEHLIFATQNGRTVISQDYDFHTIHTRWINEGRNHCGILKISRNIPLKLEIGRLVIQLYEYHQMIEIGAGTLEADIYNQLIYLS